MSLSQHVIDFVQRVREKPATGVDPAELAALRKAADEDLDGFHTALTAPNAPYSWENRVILLGAQALSERINFPFPQNMNLTGMNPTLVDLGVVAPTFVPGNVLPGLNDIDCQVDINNENFLTSLEGISSPVAGATRGGTFVTLASIGILVPRIVGLILESKTPQIGMTFRWKRGVGVYRDTVISVTMFVRRPSRMISSNVASAARGL